ncbi:hypothetical protein HOU66_gp24 [Pectobacterium phage Arno160]|uniref:Uncharacterized protein n=1 Tax=Pectobacterium phage Arno160 TaxID=2488835 RepID=A0A3G8F210_9CAUD|nr:hypothetical protein HOU66_gp24 [Pectobacterium phage Arno160]AZF88086.1 hypothetical protein Arno160_gp24 [Pectobacterium phage Arno160]
MAAIADETELVYKVGDIVKIVMYNYGLADTLRGYYSTEEDNSVSHPVGSIHPVTATASGPFGIELGSLCFDVSELEIVKYA